MSAARSRAGDFPHVLLYGPPGAGKKTIMKALLHQIYGASAAKVRVETKPWKIELPTRKLELELMTLSSNYHVELNPSDVGNNDRCAAQRSTLPLHAPRPRSPRGALAARRYVIQEIIKDMARNRSVESKKKVKVLVLHEVDSLSKQAQHSLRRTMEKYSGVCRLVMLCSTVSKVLEPVRSRCMCVRVAAPAPEQIMDALMQVSREESLDLPPPLAARVVAASGRDLRKALLCLECCRVEQFPFTEAQQPRLADWELYIAVRIAVMSRRFCTLPQSRGHPTTCSAPRAGDRERHPERADAEAAAGGAGQGVRAAHQRGAPGACHAPAHRRAPQKARRRGQAPGARLPLLGAAFLGCGACGASADASAPGACTSRGAVTQQLRVLRSERALPLEELCANSAGFLLRNLLFRGWRLRPACFTRHRLAAATGRTLAFVGGAARLCVQVVQWAAFYEHRLQEGSKAVFHIEAFVARVMAVYKNWALSAFA